MGGLGLSETSGSVMSRAGRARKGLEFLPQHPNTNPRLHKLHQRHLNLVRFFEEANEVSYRLSRMRARAQYSFEGQSKHPSLIIYVGCETSSSF